MRGQFSFNFSGDDIEAAQDGEVDAMEHKSDSRGVDEAELVPARVHGLEEMVCMRCGVFDANISPSTELGCIIYDK